MHTRPDSKSAPGRLTLNLQVVIALYGRHSERYKLPLVPEPSVVARHLGPGRLDEPQPVLLTFAPLQAEDVLTLASQRILAPPGVTRFILLEGRAVGLNVPLSLLRADTCVTRADTWLAARRSMQPAVVPGPCRVREYLGWRDYGDDEPLLVYHPAFWRIVSTGRGTLETMATASKAEGEDYG